MHETGIIKDMLEAINKLRRSHEGRPVRAITVELSKFGGFEEEHFREHFSQATQGTDLAGVDIKIKKVPLGPQARLTRVTFE